MVVLKKVEWPFSAATGNFLLTWTSGSAVLVDTATGFNPTSVGATGTQALDPAADTVPGEHATGETVPLMQ